MSSPQPPRDWDKELAEIDRLMARPAPPPGAERPAPAPPPAQRGGGGNAVTRATGKVALATWARVLLGVVAGAAITQWPWASDCGVMLYLYLGAAGVVLLAGGWGMRWSWKRQMGLAHLVSLAVALWGGYLAGRAVLDRTGYAKVTKAWVCPARAP